MKRKLQSAMAWLLVAVLTLTGVPFTPGAIVSAAGDDNKLFNASDYALETISTNKEYGDFTVKATSSKTVAIDTNNKTGDNGYTFTQRLKLGSKGTSEYGSIAFTTAGKATVNVYALSGKNSENRQLGLYEEGKEEAIYTYDAQGKVTGDIIPAETIKIDHAGDYYLASVADGVNIYMVEVVEEKVEVKKTILNANDLEDASITEEQVINGFTFLGTSGKSIAIASNTATTILNNTDNTVMKKVIKLGGTGSATERAIRFSAVAGAKVKVYALSGGDAERKLGLYNSSDVELKELAAASKATEFVDASVYDVKEDGEYYIRSKGSGINVFYIEIVEGEEEEVVRQAWDKVANPVINNVSVNAENAGKIDVSWSMVIGDQGADSVVITMKDEDNNVISTVTDKKKGDSGVATFTPAKSGEYVFVVEATRENEEVKKSNQFGLIFSRPLDAVNITKALTSKANSLEIAWAEVSEAEGYRVEYCVKGAESYTTAIASTTELTCLIGNLVAGTEYEVRVTAMRGEDTSYGEVTKVVSETVERWQTANIGVADGPIIIGEDGSVRFETNNLGKLADSEDQFSYYFTEIDPEKENFTLTATFTVNDATNRDNQSGFGIIAIDDFIPSVASSKYFNSAGCVVGKFSDLTIGKTSYGVPGGRFVTGYTDDSMTAGVGIRKLDNTKPFDWDYNRDKFPADNTSPLFQDGDTYTLTLRKSNTGFHAWMSNDQTKQVINYDPELLLKQDSEKYYVGVFATRKITVTASNIQFTVVDPAKDDTAEERPMEYITPSLSMDSTATTSSKDYVAAFKANVNGKTVLTDAAGNEISDVVEVKANQRFEVPVKLTGAENNVKVKFTPSAREEQGLDEFQELTSYEDVVKLYTITYKTYGTSENAVYVSADGTSKGDGTKESPLDVHTAVAYAQPGQTIVMLGGIYNLTQGIIIQRGNNGTEDKNIVLMAEPGKEVVLDLTNSESGGLIMQGNYWRVQGLDICNSKSGKGKPVQISGHNNVLERVDSHDNEDTGIQISGTGAEGITMWPSNNVVIGCTAYNNCDPGANDADGFAAKLTVGEGNKFLNCISYNNIDDGWDLYAKSTTGSIGAVVIDGCVAYENGKVNIDGNTKTGEGNGFKLGGESMPGKHVLTNSISFNNLGKGVTSNSGPDCIIKNVIAFDNAAENLSLYTNNNKAQTEFVVENFISYHPGKPDAVKLQQQTMFDGAVSNIYGVEVVTNMKAVESDWFAGFDDSQVPTINDNGSIAVNGLRAVMDATKDAVVVTIDESNILDDVVIGDEIVVTDKDDDKDEDKDDNKDDNKDEDKDDNKDEDKDEDKDDNKDENQDDDKVNDGTTTDKDDDKVNAGGTTTDQNNGQTNNTTGNTTTTDKDEELPKTGATAGNMMWVLLLAVLTMGGSIVVSNKRKERESR